MLAVTASKAPKPDVNGHPRKKPAYSSATGRYRRGVMRIASRTDLRDPVQNVTSPKPARDGRLTSAWNLGDVIWDVLSRDVDEPTQIRSV